jgi:hypothetical protein
MLTMFSTLIATLLLSAGPTRPPWATITKTPALTRDQVTLEFGTLGATSRQPYRLAYYARRTGRRSQAASPEVRWADSRSCPVLAELLSNLRDVPTPRIDVPGFPARPGGTSEAIVLDGISYRLSVAEGLSFSGNIGSPLERWTEQALRRLARCWRAAAPRDIE